MNNMGWRRGVGLGFLMLLSIAWRTQVLASTFTDRILTKPSISQPRDPFILIFFQGGDDHDQYGFVSDGLMSVNDWKKVFEHVGYLSPYSAFKPEDDSLWSAHGQDVAVSAAQALGRPTGGTIMGVPTNPREVVNLQKAYSQNICGRMDYFFDDDERNYGVPGGHGASRLRIEPNRSGSYLYTAATQDFDTSSAGALANFGLSFGANFDHYVFGGDTIIVGDRDDGYGMWGKGWFVEFHNDGGYFGKNSIRFFSDGDDYVESLPFDMDQARRWNSITITVSGTADPEYVQVVIAIRGVGSSIGRLQRPTFAGNRLIIGDPTGQEHEVDYGNIAIFSMRGGRKTVVAKYDFDRPGDMHPQTSSTISYVPDESGFGHDLTSAGTGNGFLSRVPTTGINPDVFQSAKIALVDWLMRARKASGYKTQPKLITNWHLGNRPGRFDMWKYAGFTNGSIDCYLARRPHAGQTDIMEILGHCGSGATSDSAARSAWSQAWLGNVHPDQAALAPDDYQTLITMAVLGGNRWFSVFTAMSDGSLGPSEATHRERAIANADALYNMAQAASWFQGTSKSLSESEISARVPLVGQLDKALFRARIKRKTSELWFAGFSPKSEDAAERQQLIVKLPQLTGVVTNLSTGETTTVRNGLFTLTLNDHARPFYFHP